MYQSREVFCLPGFMATVDKVVLPAGKRCVGLPCAAQKQEPAFRQTHGLGNNTAERHRVQPAVGGSGGSGMKRGNPGK